MIEDEHDADGGWVDTHHYDNSGSPTVEEKVRTIKQHKIKSIYKSRSKIQMREPNWIISFCCTCHNIIRFK